MNVPVQHRVIGRIGGWERRDTLLAILYCREELIKFRQRSRQEQLRFGRFEDRQSAGSLGHNRNSMEIAKEQEIGKASCKIDFLRVETRRIKRLRHHHPVIGGTFNVIGKPTAPIVHPCRNDNGLSTKSHFQSGRRGIDQADLAALHESVAAELVPRRHDPNVTWKGTEPSDKTAYLLE